MDRAVSPVVAVVLLVGITVVAATGVATVASGIDVGSAAGPAPTLSVSADAAGDRITLAHRGGATLDLRNHSIAIRIDDEPLTHQPPVPYFAAEGFLGTPTGAFNSGGDTHFSAGETATLGIASTNAPRIDPGDAVAVTVRRDGRRVATASVRAG